MYSKHELDGDKKYMYNIGVELDASLLLCLNNGLQFWSILAIIWIIGKLHIFLSISRSCLLFSSSSSQSAKSSDWKCLVRLRLCQLSMILIQVTTKNEYYDDIALLYVVIIRLFLFVFTCMLLWLSSSITQTWIKWWT